MKGVQLPAWVVDDPHYLEALLEVLDDQMME